jgi:hypothetical protein
MCDAFLEEQGGAIVVTLHCFIENRENRKMVRFQYKIQIWEKNPNFDRLLIVFHLIEWFLIGFLFKI